MNTYTNTDANTDTDTNRNTDTDTDTNTVPPTLQGARYLFHSCAGHPEI